MKVTPMSNAPDVRGSETARKTRETAGGLVTVAAAAVAAALCCVLAACTVTPVESTQVQSSSQSSAQAGVAAGESASSLALYTDIDADDAGKVHVDISSIGKDARFFNYRAGGTVIQLIGVQDESGTARLALNTCQSCSPSPRAYFVQRGAELECQNCGLTFPVESVGSKAAAGCNPTMIQTLEEQDGVFVMDAQELESYAGAFASWEGTTK